MCLSRYAILVHVVCHVCYVVFHVSCLMFYAHVMSYHIVECWWDQWILDVLLCNGLGSYVRHTTTFTCHGCKTRPVNASHAHLTHMRMLIGGE